MPAYYGSTAVFPHELIEISGADFDIDKLYMQIYQTYRKDGKLVPYGTAKTLQDKFAEFVIYRSKEDKVFKAKVKELMGLKPGDDPDFIEGNLEPNIKYDSIEELVSDLTDVNKSPRFLAIMSALGELGLPTTADEYMKFVNEGVELNNGVKQPHFGCQD
jgi:hypothetical protein